MMTTADCEKSLIGALLAAPEKIVDAIEAGVTAAWFELDQTSLTWSALEAMFRRGEIESATPTNVMTEARRIAKQPHERRVADLVTAAEYERAIDLSGVGSSLAATLRILRNATIERRVRRAAQDTFTTFDEYADGLEPVRKLAAALNEIMDSSSAVKKISPRAVFDSILAEYNEAYRMRVAADGPRDLRWTPGLPMPWPKLTEVMNGLRAGLHVIAARPSVGKTAFALNCIRFWAERGLNVLFCSLDMPRKEVLRRVLADLSRVSIRKAGYSPTHDDLRTMGGAATRASEWPLTVVETHDVDDLRTVCTIDAAANRLDVVVVDYLQLLHARALGREDAVEYARVSYVSDGMKRLANSLNVPVVALAQLNREVVRDAAAGRMPGLADLRGSGSIEQDAFTVTILHRDQAVVDRWARGEGTEAARRLIPGAMENAAYNYNLTDLDAIWWVLCKAQNGPTGKLPFVVRKKYFAWMLGDFAAQPIKKTVGYGSTAREVVDNSPKFERVHADWRHDAIEDVLRKQGALIEDGDGVIQPAPADECPSRPAAAPEPTPPPEQDELEITDV